VLRQHRKEVADLLRSSRQDHARIRVEAALREEAVLDAYALLELYLEMVAVRAPLMAATREIPRDLLESLSSCLYAATRLPELPELLTLKKLAASKYGKEYAEEASSEATASSRWMANARLVRCLTVEPPERALKFKALQAIARDHGLSAEQWDEAGAKKEMLGEDGHEVEAAAAAMMMEEDQQPGPSSHPIGGAGGGGFVSAEAAAAAAAKAAAEARAAAAWAAAAAAGSGANGQAAGRAAAAALDAERSAARAAQAARGSPPPSARAPPAGWLAPPGGSAAAAPASGLPRVDLAPPPSEVADRAAQQQQAAFDAAPGAPPTKPGSGSGAAALPSPPPPPPPSNGNGAGGSRDPEYDELQRRFDALKRGL
jgi:hypothetical protein